jgi:hypothetical protein
MEQELEGIVASLLSVVVTFAVYAVGASMFFNSVWLGLTLAAVVAACHAAKYGSGIVVVAGGFTLLILGFARAADALPWLI